MSTEPLASRSVNDPGRCSDATLRPVFVCQACGAVRVDRAPVPDQLPVWIAVKTFQTQHGGPLRGMPFMITYCPECSHHGREKVPALMEVKRAVDTRPSLATQPLDGLGEGLIALVGGVFGHVIGLNGARHA